MEYRVSEPAMNTVKLPDGTSLPALGLGTWHMGESAASRPHEVAAVRLALELGYRVIDTAEMYGEGGAEEVLGQALAEALRAGTLTREQVFIVSKVYPHNASRAGVAAACGASDWTALTCTCCTGPARTRCAKPSQASSHCRHRVASTTGA
jgi:diketogulonate reductase-like aldo/keto reductase